VSEKSPYLGKYVSDDSHSPGATVKDSELFIRTSSTIRTATPARFVSPARI